MGFSRDSDSGTGCTSGLSAAGNGIAVRKFILNKCRQRSKRPLLILAAG
jgi:hypothetical protein